MERIRERLAELERRELLGLLVVGAIVVAACALWYVRSLPKPVRIEAAAAAGGAARSHAGSAAPSPSAGPVIIVDVAGWVRHPGVYDFHRGDRVIDAIRAAGGARPGANLAAINQAALLQDAQQILVSRRGRGPSNGGGPSTDGGGTGGRIDLNSATLDQLETLPGIGEVIGQRIIDYRRQHGAFRSVQDLLNVSGIGPSHLADVKDLVTV